MRVVVAFRSLALLAATGLLLFAAPAFAACTSPAGNAGDIVYGLNNIMVYCNGTSWIGMGQVASVNYGTLTTGDICTATSGTSISCTTATINLTTQASGTLQAAQFPILIGDVTTAGGTLATTVSSIGGKAVSLGSSFTTNGAFPLTFTVTGATSLTLPTTGTLVTTTVTSLPNLAGVGTITTGIWQGTAIAPTYGGTGVTSLTAHGVVVGEGASAVVTPVGATGTVLIGNGASADPSFSTSPSLTNLTLSGTETNSFGTDYTTIGTTQSDVSLGASSSVRYSGASAAGFYGIAAGGSGQILRLHNASTASLTLYNQNLTDTTAANRIITGTGSDLVMAANSSVILQYDGTASRWRVIGGSGGGIPAGTTGQVQFNSGSNSFAADANLTWDNINKRIGIGTAVPAYAVDAAAGSVAGQTIHVNYASGPLTVGSLSGGITFGTATPGQVAYYAGSTAIAGTPNLTIGTSVVSVANLFDLTNAAEAVEIANGATATLLNKLAKLSASGLAAPLSTTDTSGAIGIVVGNAGTTGNAQIAFAGQAACAFDGATTAGHYVGISGSVAADCTDSGAAAGSGQSIGRVLSTNAAAGSYPVLLATGGGGGSGTAAGPTAFSFTNQTGVALGSTISSNFITLSGFTGTLSASCVGCTSIGRNGAWGNTSAYSPGDTIGLQLTSASSAATATTATVSLGGTTSSPWSVITGNSSPNAFAFTNQTGVTNSSTVVSNAVTLAGSFVSATATCGTGCTDIIHNGTDCNATTCAGFATGDTIAIKQIASSGYATSTTATVTVGVTVSTGWQITTGGVACTKVITASLSESNPYGVAVNISYNMVGAGGGGGQLQSSSLGGAGGGGSSAVLNAGNLVAYASGGNGGANGNGANGNAVSGSFNLASGSSLTAYVGGGGSGGFYNSIAGSGGSGYYGGGGGAPGATSTAGGGSGGSNVGGTGGSSGSGTGYAGSYQSGGLGNGSYVGQAGSQGNGGTAGSGTYSGGGGGYGGGGGGSGGSNCGGGGGTNGANGTTATCSGGGSTGLGGTGASTWSSVTTIPAAAGQGGAAQTATGSGGNGGLIILNYTAASACSL